MSIFDLVKPAPLAKMCKTCGSRTHLTFDHFAAVREPEAGTDFLPPDTDLPALSAEPRDMMDVLVQIADNTDGLNRQGDTGVIWQHLFTRLPAGAGEASLMASEKVRFLYIPNIPRSMTIYAGQSRGIFLANVVTGDTLQVELPYFLDGIYIEYVAGVADEQVNAYFSSKKIDIMVRKVSV